MNLNLIRAGLILGLTVSVTAMIPIPARAAEDYENDKPAAAIPAEEKGNPVFLTGPLAGGIEQAQPTVIYVPGDLYEYIDGQAVFYLAYNFKRLEHGFYKVGNATFFVDVYELGSPLSAFGAYRQQKEEGANDLGIGAGGAITDYLAVFHKGPHYIEIIPMDSGDDDIRDMTRIAEQVAGRIPGGTALPREVGLFPDSRLVPGTERYVDENLISYSFMGRGLVAEYDIPGQDKPVRLFMALPTDPAAVGRIMTAYRERFTESEPVSVGGREGTAGQEPYRGTTVIVQLKTAVIGALGVENRDAVLPLLTALADNLTK